MIGSAFRSHSGRNRLSGQCRDEALRFSDQWRRAGSRRKSLGVKYIYNKNNNKSFHHMYMYMSMYTRTYESLSDVLWQLRDYQADCCSIVAHHSIATDMAPYRPADAFKHTTSTLQSIKHENASNGHGDARNASGKAACLSCGTRYFPPDFRRKIGLGTNAKVEIVFFFGPDVNQKVS
jgi:hypothetical protein